MSSPGGPNSPTAKTIIPVGVKMRSGPTLVKAPAPKPPHASTPHTTQTAATKPAPPWLNTAGLTNAQMQAEADAEANASIQPQVSGLQSQQQEYDAQQKAYEAAMTGFYSALAPYMAGISGKISDAYNSAGATEGAIAQGYGGELGKEAQANSAATTAALQRGGQDQAIPSAQATANPGTALTDAFSATNGGIAGSYEAAQGAAKAADAANTPAIWAAQGRDSMTETIQKAVAGDANYAAQIKQVYDTVPALRQTILNQIQTAQLDKAKLQDSEQNTAFNQAAKKVSLNQAATKINIQQASAAFDQKYKIASLNLKGQSLQLQANKFAQSTLNANRNYGIALAKLGIATKKAQTTALASEYKLQHGGYTQTQINKFNSVLQGGLNDIQTTNNTDGTTSYFVTNPNPKNKAGWTKKGGVYTRPVTYEDFLTTSVAAGVPPSIAVARANKFFPPAARPQGPGALDFLLGTGTNPNGGSRGSSALPGTFERVDQGVDFMASSPVKSLAPGRVVSITKGMAGGTGHIIKVLLDQPITVNGRTYYGIYYSEQSPLVKVGQRLRPNTSVMAAGGNEIGFLDKNMQMPPLVGGLGAETKPSVGGQDFQTWLGG